MPKSAKMKNLIAASLFAAFLGSIFFGSVCHANESIDYSKTEKSGSVVEMSVDGKDAVNVGGGYALSGQSKSLGYTAEVYDENNGLITSDANYILGASDGFVWVGSYSGIFRYDGKNFEQMKNSEGLTSGRGLFEDSKGRIYVGTNDSGVVVIDGYNSTWITKEGGLPSSSIRSFAEDDRGNVFIGTTNGLCYVDSSLNVHKISNEQLDGERILKLSSDGHGIIYGSTKSGMIFSIEDQNVKSVYTSAELIPEGITSILADPHKDGKVYITTDRNNVYYGNMGDSYNELEKISAYPLVGIHWINYDCGRIWLSSTSQMGYLDEEKVFHLVEDLPIKSGIEMVTSDYQGNLWIASSTQGVMKVVSCNFIDLYEKYGLSGEVTNSACILDDVLYVGTEKGIRILDNGRLVENRLTRYLDNVRIRCIMKDSADNLWISTYTGLFGLVCYSKSGEITNYTTSTGLPSDEIRGTVEASDGSVYVCTSGGFAIIKDGVVVKKYDALNGMQNTVILTAAEGKNGGIYVGTDGDGIYAISGDEIKRIGKNDGLSSDVVLKIKKVDDEDRYWIITSNSIGYYENGKITTITSFPYNNNYDIFKDDKDNLWIISSYGLFMVNEDEMIKNEVNDYRLYTLTNGLPYKPTSNSYGTGDDEGNIYIPGRRGVCKVDLNSFFNQKMTVKATIKSVYFGDDMIAPDVQGRYVLPASDARIKITASVLDYTFVDPLVNIYIEGMEDDAIFAPRSNIPVLEYTGMKYGNYTLHLRVLAGDNSTAMLDQTYRIFKKPRLTELLLIRVLMFVVIAAVTAFVVIRVLNGTVIKRQLNEIRQARDDAERANMAKTRFLANISHEIRTPINTILGMDEMIMREDATGVPKGYFISMMNYAFDIKNATDSLLGLINDLLDISKIESGKMHLVEQEYDIKELLRSIVSMIRVKSTEKELIFDVVVDEVMPQKYYGDAGKIKQIVLNLLTNAVKYTEKGGFVLSVSMTERIDEEANLVFSVKDTGMGVKTEDIDKLFTAYERLDEQKNSGIQGTGLGLDISRRFALLMGGSLTCESVYGEGSEFILSVRQKIVDDTPVGLFVEHEEKTAKGPYVPKFIAPDADVLVVDDNPMNLNVIKGLLKATKIFVTTADSGEDCLEKMKTTKFNVVLLDHMMPGMDGIETVAKIRETDKEIPVYALTANTSVGEDFYKSKGFTGYLSKPVDTEELEKTIMKHLPEEIMLKPTEEAEEAEPEEIPKEMSWIYETPGISVEEGIKNSGGISSYIFSLKLFLDTIDGNAKVISDAYEAGDIRLYTIKVHALKSSARIIGATELAKLCASLEDAGNKHDKEFIDLHNEDMLKDYLEYKDKLSGLSEKTESDADKKDISEDEIKDAYSALKDMIPQMDYDAVDFILSELRGSRLPEEDEKTVSELLRLLKVFDWEGMEKVINKDSE